ncbi:ATP-dependent RNA helicase DHX29 [Apiospora phragmitis]|uniref:ATP-dependent RNA helicase DHX29 n=1 Tax=Apiospora phragmitis TaxID=2905665 RepID=A0ABR1VZ37_9PEZI
MAPKKKKTKPSANPARGFATTSVTSKPVTRIEQAEEASVTPNGKGTTPLSASIHEGKAAGATPENAPAPSDPTLAQPTKLDLSPEEFEKQLLEAELQLLVEKHAQKVKRDAQRQKIRLETDRRLLRGQAEPVNARKWLPQELMDHILDLIQAEHRFAASSLGPDTTSSGRLLPEEELTMKLWTLQQALASAGFTEEKVASVLQYILEIAPNIGGTTKENIWGLEEALDWLARECSRDELPDYDQRGRTFPRLVDTPQDSPLASGANTPRMLESSGTATPAAKNGSAKSRSSRAASPKKLAPAFDSDIEPDDLVPVYLESKAKLFQIQRPKQDVKQTKAGKNKSVNGSQDVDMEEAKLLAKIEHIEQDVLFDKISAEQTWRNDRVILEREYAAAKKQEADDSEARKEEQDASDDDEIAREAKKMATEVLQQDSADDEQSLSDLFASLPVQEVDPSTGKTENVINSTDGSKVFIRHFGKWTGVSPMRALEETCRSRDPAVKLQYRLISEASFANRHVVVISWSKPQELISTDIAHIESYAYPLQFSFGMADVATPDSKQSEAYIATAALFAIFHSTKEEKVFMRLPVVWKELWNEFAQARKSHNDAQDRASIKELRCMVRQRQDQEEEDGILLQGAFRGRRANQSLNDSGDSGSDREKGQSINPELYQRIWANKCGTPRYQAMLASHCLIPPI